MSKKLVVFFSASGITKKVAQKLAKAIDADLFEIQPNPPYTKADLDWTDPNSRSSIEMKNKASRPAIAGKLPDITAYDTVFIGFPIWWYVAPTIINTFLESYAWAGKTIVPFATSGGSGMGRVTAALAPSCPGATVKEGRLLNGNVSPQALKQWVESL